MRRFVFGEQSMDRLRFEVTPIQADRIGQMIKEKIPQFIAKPVIERNAESHFSPRGNLGWNHTTINLFEDIFRGRSRHLLCVRQRGG